MNNNESNALFSLTFSFTGTQFIVDSTQLNTIHSALAENSAARETLSNIEVLLRNTYAEITPKLKSLLEMVLGAEISASQIKSVSESTIFYNEGDDCGA